MTSPDAGAAPRRRLKRAEREASLLEAAAGVVRDEGVEALTMEALADRAGVNKAIVYRFYANRDAVLVALWDHETARFDAAIADALADCDSLEAQLRAILDTSLDALAAGTILESLEAPGIGSARLIARRQARTVAVVTFLADLIRAARPMSKQDALTTAAVLGQGARGLASLRASTGWSRPRLTRTFVRLCIGAIDAAAS